MTAAGTRHRVAQLFGALGFLAMVSLLGLLTWKLTPPEGPPLSRPRRGLARAQMPEDANLVLITIEGLRVDRLGSYGDAPLSPTPYLDRLMGEAFRFEQATTPVPLSFPSHAALMTGISPIHRQELVQMGGTLPDGRATLAEILKSSGFRTAAFVGSSAVGRAAGLARGFDRFDEPRAGDRPATIRFLAERPAAEVIGAARDWLDDNFRGRFFLWVELADPLPPHPAVAPRPLLRARPPYDAEVEQADAEIGRLLARLSSLGVMGHTLVAVVAVHGVGLGEHGETGAGFQLYDTTVRVPMALRLPGAVARDRSIPEQVRLFDLMPTLLDLLRLAAPEAPDGVSLVPLLDPGGEIPPLPVIAQASAAEEFLGAAAVRSIRAGGYKLIEGRGDELYDLRRDRSEARNLAPSEQARVAELHHDLEAAWPAGPGSTEESPAALILPAATLLQAAPLLEEGIVALRGNDPARARRALEDARRLVEGRGRPAPPALLALIGAAVRLQGRPSEALRLDEDALGALDGKTPPLVALLQSEIGACRRLEGELPAALVAYRAAVAARPHDVDDRCALAEVFIESGQANEAIEELRAGLARAPGQPQLLAVLGRALIATGEPQAAVGPLLEAVRNAPWLNRPWFDLAQVYEALGRPAEAARTYQYFLTHEPESENPLRTEAAGRLRVLQPG